MNQSLWEKIEAFKLDDPLSEYGFNLRLAYENYWTLHFTEKAIMEYKKFMYLAATADGMVSPSPIIDKVWHQHLIFSKMYEEFCEVLGKHVNHVPSTHDKKEVNIFRLAKERTQSLYEATFGPQPSEIWGYKDMYANLHLEKGRFKLRTIIIIGLLICLALYFPAYLLLQPLISTIGNPDFLNGLFGLAAITFIGLELFNRFKLQSILKQIPSNAFIFDLSPSELIFLKTKNLSNVVLGSLNALAKSGHILIGKDSKVSASEQSPEDIKNIRQRHLYLHISDCPNIKAESLINNFSNKPIFKNIASSMVAFEKYFRKSKLFQSLFNINFVVINFIILIAFIRLASGIAREKPVTWIALVFIGLVIAAILYLYRLTVMMGGEIIPLKYKKETKKSRQKSNDLEMAYFLAGSSFLLFSLRSSAKSESSGFMSAACGGAASCGSSCGGSCGGCGGCGG
jgi:hypothetical protein